jgi:imidazolonepropionase-like amidohydrolase
MNIAPTLLAGLLTGLVSGVVSGSFAASSLDQSSDPLAPRPNGMESATPSRHLIVDATVHTSPGTVLQNTDVLIADGKIVAVGTDLTPGSATVWSIDGAHVYAGFIDPYIEVDPEEPDSTMSGAHWNALVTPHQDALNIGLGADASKSLRAMGFTTAMIVPESGIFRGWSGIVSTAQDFNDDSLGDPPVYQAQAGQIMGFERSSWPNNNYPNSHMGVVALMRQTFSDAAYRDSADHADASCLDHINPSQTTFYFNTSHELESLLADDIASEMNHERIVLVDNGTAHRRLSAFKEMGHPVIVPLRFAETPDVFSVGAADSTDLATLQHWERAPANARWLTNSGLDVALTTSKLRSDEKFWTNLHTAIEKGLDPEQALAMMTTSAAKIIGLEGHGAIEPNSVANLVVASGDLFDPSDDAKVIDTWVDGRRHHINDVSDDSLDGAWNISVVGTDYTMDMTIDGKSISMTEKPEDEDPIETKATKVSVDNNAISFVIDYTQDDVGAYVSSATLMPDGTIRGVSMAPNQKSFQWNATKSKTITMSTFTGTWNALLSDEFKLDLKITQDDDNNTVTVIERVEDGDDIKQEATDVEFADGVLKFSFEHEPFGMEGIFNIALSPSPEKDELLGAGTLPSGDAFVISATKASKDSKKETHKLPDLPESRFGPFSYDKIPEQGSALIVNATVWTQSDQGVMENGWILFRDGKIMNVGNGPTPRIATNIYIDAKGMHITPGLIDAHSHTGLFRFGVNESGQAVTSEVRISDSLDPGHPGFYRELAGGLTTAMLLHGSANPIGGQSKTIKLRWNSDKPSDMFFEGAKPGIKFALGENVKQSNWGDRNTTRYPQTRLGVETLIRDRFTKAREYAIARNELSAAPRSGSYFTPKSDTNSSTDDSIPARDLELEALAQILAGERWIHCHSYRQDEILMLCRIAEEFNFKIGTFQHGLETYKVAEIVKEHAIGASIFSDWWAYKVEVVDAIPFAGPINHEVGLLTSFNSDSDDVARRMHVEAGKALKYAKLSGIEMSEQDALNFVTMNAAIQLGIQDRVGSLETGKDADIVVWTGHPLSSLSRPEMTFVDGRLYFSRDNDAALQTKNASERERLIQMILSEGKPAGKKDKSNGAKGMVDSNDPDMHHDHDDHDGHNHHFDLHGADHSNQTQGDCGCSQLLPAWNTDY